MIDLFAPYERRTIQVVGSREALQKQQVRAVVVQVEYAFFGERRRHQVVVRPDQQGAEPTVEATLPLGEFRVRLRRHLAARWQPPADQSGARCDRRGVRGRTAQRGDVMLKRSVGMVLLIGLLTAPASAVVLDDTNRITIQLQDGTQVILLGEAIALSTERSNRYYYLPVNLRLSKRPDGTPEFLFLKFTSEKSAAQGGIGGGLMHFLMEWGLTPPQEEELRATLKARKAELIGAAPLDEAGEGGSFQIVSATLSDKGMATALVTSGKAPLLPGGKAAAASRLTADGAQLLAATFEKTKSITDVSIALNYGYQTLMPAARGVVTVDWSKLVRERDSFIAEYKKTRTGTDSSSGCVLFACWFSSAGKYSVLLQRDAQPVEVPRGKEGHRHQVRRADRRRAGGEDPRGLLPVLPEQDGGPREGRGAAARHRQGKGQRRPTSSSAPSTRSSARRRNTCRSGGSRRSR